MEGCVKAVKEFKDKYKIPSLAFGIVGSSTPPVLVCLDCDENTVFRIASMTKSFTAYALLLLRDEKKLRLDDPVVDYVPQLASLNYPVSDCPEIRIRDLMSMKGGFATDDPWADRLLDMSEEAFSDLIRSQICRFTRAPGMVFEYSNLGYAILGRVVQRASGMRCQDFIQTRILDVLGLHNTGWHAPAHYAGPHEKGGLPGRLKPLGDGEVAPMGGLFSTLRDVSQWVMHLAKAFPEGRSDQDNGPLKVSSRREMQSVHTAFAPPGFRWNGPLKTVLLETRIGYGFGVNVSHHSTWGTTISHSGGLPGYGSHMRWMQRYELGLVALGNVTYAKCRKLCEIVQDLLNPTLMQKTPIAPLALDLESPMIALRRLMDLIGKWDAQEAQDLFAFNVFLDRPDLRGDLQALGELNYQVEGIANVSGTKAEAHLKLPNNQLKKLVVLLAPTKKSQIQWFKLAKRN